MRRGIALGASALAFTTAMALAGHARADEPALNPPANPPPPATANANADAHGSVAVGGSAQASGNGTGAMTLPREERREDPPPAPARARVVPGNSDHDQFVGTLAIGYLGRRDMVAGCNGATTQPGDTCADGRQTVAAPVIGVRYWITDLIGIDGGLGLAINSLSGNNVAPRPHSTAFLLHGGVPLALASAGHFTFEVVPEMNIGFSSWSQNGVGDGSGFHFDIGARAGAEIHFGFIGIPQLSLQGTIGLALAFDTSKVTPTGGASQSQSDVVFATSVQDSPWNIFTSNVAALYYF